MAVAIAIILVAVSGYSILFAVLFCVAAMIVGVAGITSPEIERHARRWIADFTRDAE